jgi:hypothetical protein
MFNDETSAVASEKDEFEVLSMTVSGPMTLRRRSSSSTVGPIPNSRHLRNSPGQFPGWMPSVPTPADVINVFKQTRIPVTWDGEHRALAASVDLVTARKLRGKCVMEEVERPKSRVDREESMIVQSFSRANVVFFGF